MAKVLTMQFHKNLTDGGMDITKLYLFEGYNSGSKYSNRQQLTPC
jgi:hypothetical protein